MKLFYKQIFPILLIFLLIPIILPFFHNGFFVVHDNTQVPRVYEMGKALHDGEFPVRWVKDLGYGYGYPIFNFYSPLPYYIGGVLTQFSFDPLTATKIMFVLPILLSGIFIFGILKIYIDDTAALAAAVIYAYFPYHAVNIYIRGDIGELYAYAFLPLVFGMLYRLFKLSQKNTSIYSYLLTGTFAGFSIALVIISHNLSAYMLFLLLVPILLIFLLYSNYKKALVMVLIYTFSLGFLLSAFYALPALSEMKYTNVASQVGGGADYKDHFVCLSQLWNSPWGYGGSTKGCLDGFSFRLGKVNIMLILGAIVIAVLFFKRKKYVSERFVLLGSIGMFVVSIFLTTDYSLFLWKTLPAMGYLQYPWRFLNFSAFFASIIIGYGIYIISKFLSKKFTYIIVFLIIALTVFQNVKLFRPQEFLNISNNDYISTDYINWDVSKISDEYLPKNFLIPKSSNTVSKIKAEIIAGNAKIFIEKNNTTYLLAHGEVLSDSLVRLHIPYFPAWNIYVDQKAVDYAVKNNGYIVLLHPGSHTIETKFEQTPIEFFSNTLTVFGICLAIFAIMIGRKMYYGSKKTS